MTMWYFLVWSFCAASLAFAGDGLESRSGSANLRDLGRVLFAFSGAMLMVQAVVIFCGRLYI
ncbi:MAG: hypothetical protein IIZ83_06595 [Oscillospiraceae bacterium]|nr:hypothetical protein [Oscillospiraceae bacterium]